MKKLFIIAILFTSLAVVGLAQEGKYEGRDVYDATAKAIAAPVALQTATATFTFTRKLDGATQQAADRKLAAYLAAYAEAKGKSGMCVVAGDGACLSIDGAIIYDLAKVSAAIEAILTTEMDGAARDRFKGPKLEAARKKADEDFDKEEKPAKTAATPRPASRRRQ